MLAQFLSAWFIFFLSIIHSMPFCLSTECCSFSHAHFPATVFLSMLFEGLHCSPFLSISPFSFCYIVPSLMLFYSLVLSSYFLFLSILRIFQLSHILPFLCPMFTGYFALFSPVSALPTTFPFHNV